MFLEVFPYSAEWHSLIFYVYLALYSINQQGERRMKSAEARSKCITGVRPRGGLVRDNR